MAYVYFDYADALALREMASQADLPKYLLAPEVSLFLR
ncbi:phage integrase family protein, partial [Klebsiella pneumoniae]|nr:phage integrase family protein [Klebsiella pneumoniae]